MRLGLVVFSAAVVIGGYALVNSVESRPAETGDGSAPAAQAERSRLPDSIGEPVPELRTYELIRYVNKDGSFGMVDDPTRVPPGAAILGRERKTVTVARPGASDDVDPAFAEEMEEEERLVRMVEQRQESMKRLASIQRRVAETVLGSGLFGADSKLGKVQKDLDEMQREADRANDCADGDCPELVPAAAGDELRSAVPKAATRR